MAVLDLLPLKKKKAKVQAPRGVAAPPISVPLFVPPIFPSQHPVPPRLASKLKALRQRFLLIHGSERIAQCWTAALMLIPTQMFVDWIVDLPFFIRFLILGGDFALLYFFLKKHFLPLVLRPPSQEACALLVEKKWPKFRGRIIAAVQFANPRHTPDQSPLVEILQQQAEGGTGALDFGEIVPGRPLARRLFMAVTVTLLFGCTMVHYAPGSVALLERVFLLPAKVPRKTEVICISKDKTIPVGDSVVIEAEAIGIIPSHGRVTLKYDSGRIQEITIDPEHDRPDYFSLNVDLVQESMTYVVRLNDGVSETYSIKTVPRPNVATVDCIQVYPAYTGLPDTKRTVGNLALLAGSKLKIHMAANSKIVKASLKLAGLDQVRPITIGGADGKDLSGDIDIPATGLTGFYIELTNEAGVTSGDQTLYRIDIIPDRPPTVDLTIPERLEELCTLKATTTIGYIASDDYGLAKLTLCYRIAQDPDAAAADTSTDPNAPPPPAPEAKRIELPIDKSKGLPLNMKSSYPWVLAGIQPAVHEGISLEYWIEAQDANNVTGPGITESEHHVLKIVTPMEKLAEINARLLDKLSGIQDATDQQTKLNTQLGNAIQGRTAPTPTPPQATPPK